MSDKPETERTIQFMMTTAEWSAMICALIRSKHSYKAMGWVDDMKDCENLLERLNSDTRFVYSDWSYCRHCGKQFPHRTVGRTPHYCGTNCRQGAKRARDVQKLAAKSRYQGPQE